MSVVLELPAQPKRFRGVLVLLGTVAVLLAAALLAATALMTAQAQDPLPTVPAGFQIEVLAEIPERGLTFDFGPGGPFGTDIYVSAFFSQKFFRVDPLGNVSEFPVAPVFVDPSDVNFDRTGTFGGSLFFESCRGDFGPACTTQIVQVDPAGNATSFVLLQGGNASDFDRYTIDNIGNFGNDMFVMLQSADGFFRINQFGSVNRFSTLLHEKVNDIAFSPGGGFGTEMYLAQGVELTGGPVGSRRILKMDAAGNLTTFSAAFSDVTGSPTGLAFGPGGAFGTNLYVAAAEGTIRTFDPSGTATEFASGFVLPVRHRFDPSGAFDGGLIVEDRVQGATILYKITGAAPPTPSPTPTDTPTPAPGLPTPIGGIGIIPGVTGGGPNTGGAAVLAWLAVVTAGALALVGAAWYVRRRWLRYGHGS